MLTTECTLMEEYSKENNEQWYLTKT
jgi:hypothetical protein